MSHVPFDASRPGRCFGSKTGYLGRHPGHQAIFNAQVVTASRGRIWFGDLDLELDGADLCALAAREGADVLVLYDSDFLDGEKPGLSRYAAKYRADGTAERRPRS